MQVRAWAIGLLNGNSLTLRIGLAHYQGTGVGLAGSGHWWRIRSERKLNGSSGNPWVGQLCKTIPDAISGTFPNQTPALGLWRPCLLRTPESSRWHRLREPENPGGGLGIWPVR